MLLLIIVLNIIGGSACISSDVLTGMKGPALILFSDSLLRVQRFDGLVAHVSPVLVVLADSQTAFSLRRSSILIFFKIPLGIFRILDPDSSYSHMS